MDEEYADEYEGHIIECTEPFTKVGIDSEHVNMLTESIQSALEVFLVSRDISGNYLSYEEGDDDEPDSENVDQIGETEEHDTQHRDTGVRERRKQIQITDSITTTSNNSDVANEQAELDIWMDRVMAKTEQQYLDDEYSQHEHDEAHAKARASQYIAAGSFDSNDIDFKQADSSDESVQEVRRLPQCNASSSSNPTSPTSSDDTLHSSRSIERRQGTQPEVFASPEPYQIRKSAHSTASREGNAHTGAEPLPAWLLPKSPLDSHFRKGYGGLGHQDLDDVIAEVTSSQKKALRESKIADDNEQDSLNSGNDRSTSHHSSSERSDTDTGALDDALPAWEIPKSPLDAHFRKGYGGLGHGDFNSTVEEMNTAQKKARAAMRAHKRRMEGKVGALYSNSESSVCDTFSETSGEAAMQFDGEPDSDAQQGDNLITVDDLPDDFGAAHTALNPTTVGTPVHQRPASRGNSSTTKTPVTSVNRSRGSEYAKQTKLFQSPNPSNIRVTVTSKTKSIPKQLAEEALPAWEIPKSPLDAHFRKGYGGLGHGDFNNAVEEISTAQKKARATVAAAAARSPRQDGAAPSEGQNSISKMLNFWLESKRAEDNAADAREKAGKLRGSGKLGSSSGLTAGTKQNKTQPKAGSKSTKNAPKKAEKKPSTRLAARKAAAQRGAGDLGEASEQIMFDRPVGEEKEYSRLDELDRHAAAQAELLGDDGSGSHILPAAHPVHAAANDTGAGTASLTGNDRLNAMIAKSYREHVAQYSGDPAPAGKSASAEKHATARHTPTKEPSAVDQDIREFLTSPHLQHSMDEIDDIIRANLRKLRKMQLKTQALQKSASDRLDSEQVAARKVSKVAPTKARSTSQPKLTVRSASNYLVAPSSRPSSVTATARTKPVAKEKHHMVRCKSMYPLHLRSTGNLRASTLADTTKPQSTPASHVTGSRRSSLSTAASFGARSEPSAGKSVGSKVSTHLLSLHAKPTASFEAKHTQRNTTTPSRARPLSPHSRLLAPTQAAVIRVADIATNSSAAANLHNEWHLHLREDDPEGGADLPERKQRNQAIRRSLPAGGADRIIGWSSPGMKMAPLLLIFRSLRIVCDTVDRKSKSLDGSLGIRNHALCVLDNSGISSSSPFSTPTGSPLRRRRQGDPVYIPPISRDSRLTEPTVSAVMRSLDAAKRSPVIKRLQRELSEQTSRAYLFRGPKFARNLASLELAGAKKKRKVKRRRAGKKKP
jgi:hypothetical protein